MKPSIHWQDRTGQTKEAEIQGEVTPSGLDGFVLDDTGFRELSKALGEGFGEISFNLTYRGSKFDNCRIVECRGGSGGGGCTVLSRR